MRTLAQPVAAGPVNGAPPNMRRSYDRYFSTGLYSARYPAPNRRLLNLILREAGPAGARILDFGCGTGRYALALARYRQIEVFGYDISPAAIQDLSRRAEELRQAGALPGRLDMLCGSFEELERRLDGDPGFDLVALLFGVLGHIPTRERRVAVLRSLRLKLKPGGRLIVTVPNRARRFAAEQRACAELVASGVLEPGDIHYQRTVGDEAIDLYYHLYSPAEFRAELGDAGFAVPDLVAESVLSEKAVLTAPAWATLDGLLSRVTPVSLAYGMVAVARPVAVPAT